MVNILGYGSKGRVIKPSGKIQNDLVYIMLEFINGGLLFDLCQTIGETGFSENNARFLFSQMVELVSYLNSKGVAHRDLKLESILVDKSLRVKVAGFGSATFKNVKKLETYKGTTGYIAPEILNGKSYNGFQADMFSLGVIFFRPLKRPFSVSRSEGIRPSLLSHFLGQI